MTKLKTDDNPGKEKPQRKSRSKNKNSNPITEVISTKQEEPAAEQKKDLDKSLEMNLLKEYDFKINLPHAYKNTLSVFQKNVLTLAKRIFKNITESIEDDKVACDI